MRIVCSAHAKTTVHCISSVAAENGDSFKSFVFPATARNGMRNGTKSSGAAANRSTAVNYFEDRARARQRRRIRVSSANKRLSLADQIDSLRSMQPLELSERRLSRGNGRSNKMRTRRSQWPRLRAFSVMVSVVVTVANQYYNHRQCLHCRNYGFLFHFHLVERPNVRVTPFDRQSAWRKIDHPRLQRMQRQREQQQNETKGDFSIDEMNTIYSAGVQ